MVIFYNHNAKQTNMMNESKQFFLPGDVVTLRQDLPHKPTMLVVRKVTKTIRTQDVKNDYFQGILCKWFTTDGTLQESIFNTKDLQKL
jgi:uncharacterized protein YodC (DUF2158 family)